MIDKTAANFINIQLAKKYGKADDGRPNWRIVLNEKSLTEKRYSSAWKYDRHGNFLAEENGVREMPKYSYIPYGVWILEQLIFTPKERLPKELAMVDENCHGTYEPRWPFMTKDYKPLDPMLEGCDFIIESNSVLNRAKRKSQIKTRKQLEAIERAKFGAAFDELIPAFDGKKHSRMYPVKTYGEETLVGNKTSSSSQSPDSSNGSGK